MNRRDLLKAAVAAPLAGMLPGVPAIEWPAMTTLPIIAIGGVDFSPVVYRMPAHHRGSGRYDCEWGDSFIEFQFRTPADFDSPELLSFATNLMECP